MEFPEIWKPVKESKGFYEISSAGRLRRLKPGHGTRVGYIHKPKTNHSGYFQYSLSIDSKRLYKSAHRLVADAFIGPRPKGYEVNHINSIKADNRPENLEYVLPKHNRINHKGEKNGRSKLTEKDVIEIRRLLALGHTHRTIAPQFRVSAGCIHSISRGKNWKHIK